MNLCVVSTINGRGGGGYLALVPPYSYASDRGVARICQRGAKLPSGGGGCPPSTVGRFFFYVFMKTAFILPLLLPPPPFFKNSNQMGDEGMGPCVLLSYTSDVGVAKICQRGGGPNAYCNFCTLNAIIRGRCVGGIDQFPTLPFSTLQSVGGMTPPPQCPP